jgi:tRNA-dihydrouridine synthase B
VCLEHVELSVKQAGEPAGVKRMRKHMVWYTRGMPRSKELRLKLFTLETLDQVRYAFGEYLAHLEKEQETA